MLSGPKRPANGFVEGRGAGENDVVAELVTKS